MKFNRNCLFCVILILTISFSEARHLKGKISDAATRISQSLNQQSIMQSGNDNSVLKRNSNSVVAISQNDRNNKTKMSSKPQLGEFKSIPNILHEHSEQQDRETTLLTKKQSDVTKGGTDSFVSSNIIQHVNQHHPNASKTITNAIAVKERNGDNTKSNEFELNIRTNSLQNNENHGLHKDNNIKPGAKTLGSSVQSVSENDAVVVAKDDSKNRLRPTVTVFIEEKNPNGHTQRVIASSGDGVIKSKTVHVNDETLDSNGSERVSPNDILNTDDSSNKLENNKVSPNVIHNNDATTNIIEHSDVQADVIGQSDVPSNHIEHSGVPVNGVEHIDVQANGVEHSVFPSNVIEHSDVPANEVESNEVPANVDEHSDDLTGVDDVLEKEIKHTDSLSVDKEHSDVSANLLVTGTNVDSANIIEDGEISANAVNINKVSSDIKVHDKDSSSDRENNEISSDKINNNEVHADQMKTNEVLHENTLRKEDTGHKAMTRNEAISENYDSKITPTMAVLDNAYDNKMPLKNIVEPAEANADNLHNVDTTGNAVRDISIPETTVITTESPTVMATTWSRSTKMTTPTTPKIVNKNRPTAAAPTVRRPEDVTPLDIFTSDIKYQRFPRPMSLTTLKNKVLGKPLKKLYILEESEKKLFQHVRQLEAIYTIEDGELYVSFLFRFIYSRKCQEIKKFKMGNLVGNTDIAMFEKEMDDGKTERIMFFSERPEDYVFFMSCTDMKTSPYACRDTYYVTLDTTHDPPNQFPWADAANELESKLSITFEDPRFIFNFVLLPCARSS
ncbi:uncharacterized protein LOC132749570 [Ruditapes philippinarum]|uniref:uncharacterized protein LOC132749570 n=1 Tax=Ruditapes philippinarum TaxID=129788 RepID=UPI00295B5C51|nr:uncharacterized protein LOC132749570 [Ruditapes philippinarum]